MNGEGDGGYVSRRRILAATGAISVGWLAGCVGGGGNPDSEGGGTGEINGEMTSGGESQDSAVEDDQSVQDGPEEDDSMATGDGMDWKSRELTDVLTDESFTISELPAPIVIQSFAVWCSNCKRQSEELLGLDESITRVGLNTDPNEDAEKVKQHAERNGFDWRFAVAPTAMTKSLIDEFGPTITNAPSTPIIVVCNDGSTKFFSGRHQSAEELHAAAAEC